MKRIERGEVLGIADYETVRERFRQRVIAAKKLRRVQVGEHVSAVFENRDSVLLQIQEMLRTERITREGAIQHEIDTYNELIPNDNELSCTLMIEIPDKETRDAFLVSAEGFEDHVWLIVGGQRVRAWTEPSRRLEGRTSAVHYMKFKLSEAAAGMLRKSASANETVTHSELVIDHPAYTARAVLPVETIVSLGEDLVG